VARFSDTFKQQVLAATDIVEFIGQYVALKKRGKEFVGLCPFHADNNPSMYVSPVKQIYKCFVCGAGGDAFNFLMSYEKLAFPEAIRTLAERAGIPIPTEFESAPPRGDGLDKKSLLSLTAFARQFFRDQLFSPAGRDALAYARSRELTEETISEFQLGFAPDAWDGLTQAARRKGFSQQQLLEAGLAAPRNNGQGIYDRFRNRLMFPICDLSGNVIAFGGRALAADERAKYINSPETPLFDKSRQMFALDKSRDAIRAASQAIVTEGYLDAIIAIQSGVTNTVATLGTALTAGHVRQLSHFADEVVLVFDADVAGVAAAERALDEFIAQRVSVRVATIPEGKDPADFCLACGGEAFREIIAAAPDAMDYMLQSHMRAYRDAGDNLATRQQIIEQFLGKIVNSAAYGAIGEIERGQLAQHIGHLVNLPAADLQQQMQRLARRNTTRSQQADGPGPATQATLAAMPLAERHLIEVLLNVPDLLDHVLERVDPTDFTDGTLRLIAHNIWQLGSEGPWHLEQLMVRDQMAQMGSVLTDLVMAGERRGNYDATLTGAADDIVRRREQRELDSLKADGSEEARRKLTQQLKAGDTRRRPKIR
jgi:DNA primase